MDRLPALIALAAALGSFSGCEREGGDGGEAAPAGRSRVAAVTASEDERSLEHLCDVLPEPASAPELALPPLSADSPSPPAEGWRWINLWATWCKPCVEEIPMLREWASELSAGGAPLRLVFISVDDSAEAVEAYAGEHPGAPTEYRARDPEAVLAWARELGLAGGTVPIHIVVDPENRVRCLRGGKVSPRDLPLVRRLLAGGD